MTGAAQRLSFATVSVLDPETMEIIVDRGVMIDDAMLDEWLAYMDANLKRPFKVLFNKVYNFSYTFDAQMRLCENEDVKAVAIVNYRRRSEMTTLALLVLFKGERKWGAELFSNRDDAYRWLSSRP